MIGRKYRCNSCGDEWWATRYVKSKTCKKCDSKEIELIDYEYPQGDDFSGQ